MLAQMSQEVLKALDPEAQYVYAWLIRLHFYAQYNTFYMCRLENKMN